MSAPTEIHEPLLRILKQGYGRFRTRRIVEAIVLGASVFVPTLLGALVLGLLLGDGKLGAWLVPITVAAGAIAAIVRVVRYMIRHHMSFGLFLLSVEERAGLARNELFNALQLGRRASRMKDRLARDIAVEILRRGAETARKIPYAALSPVRSLRGSAGQVGGALVLILLLGLLAPQAVLRTAGQVLHPGTVPESDLIEVLVEPGDCTVTRGTSVTVLASLVGITGEPTLFHRAGGGAWQRATMDQSDARFSAILSDLQAETEYAVSVGDHRSRTYLISLVEPLRATGYEKRITFPVYSGLAPEKVLSPHGSITALVGSEVELRVSLSRSDATGKLVFDSGYTIPLDGASESLASARFSVRSPDLFRVELSSPSLEGLSWSSEPFHVDPIPDRSPSLYLLAPGEQVDLPPEMRVVLEIDCADDFGITKLDLVWRRNDSEPSRFNITRWTAESEARVLYPWNLEEITMVPGDRIVYHLELSDNDAVSGPKTTRSPDYVIRFPTIEEMYAQQEEERHSGMEDLRNSLDQQVQLREQLDRITEDLRQDKGVEWEQKQEVEEFLSKQEEILQKMEDLSEAMDRQLDRIQQGELFTPEMVAKISQIQEMVQQIQDPEFHEHLEQMRKAMESLDPREVREALEQMKLTQKEIEQGLDRTLAMLEKMLAEEKLDELIRRAERLEEKQNKINEEASKGKDGEAADSTSAMSEEEAQELAEQQAAAREDLEALKKQMQELSEMAQRSHQEMSEQLQSEKGEESRQDLAQAAEQMEQSETAMSCQNRNKSSQCGNKASAKVRSFVNKMREMQTEIEMDKIEELSRQLLQLAGTLVDQSQMEEDLVLNAQQKNTRDLAVEQDRIARAARHVVDRIYELARETPFISPKQARALGEMLSSLTHATDAFETGRRSGGMSIGRRSQSMMDEIVASLLQSNDSMCSNSSSSCNNPNPSAMMSGLSNQQQGVNRGTQQLMSESQGSRLSDQGIGKLDQLAAQQEQIRAGLREVAGSLGDRQDVLGRLDELGKEMEEIVEEMRERNLDERLLRRQERILSRLLTAQRSIRRQDFEEQRRSRTGVDPHDRDAPGPVVTGLSRKEQIRRGILKGAKDPIPDDYRRLVDEYFRALTGETR